jgi:protein involved in ribonucleotide reduction
MLIFYDSLSGNVKRFINKLSYKSLRVRDEDITEPYILVTYTIGFGDIPQTTKRFLERNHHNLVAVASSGNKNWGDNFGKAADKIAQKYNVPIILKFELSGTAHDTNTFIQEVERIVRNEHSKLDSKEQ